jgi:uncharacterized repeat protein (TIGR03803 family)
LLGGCGPLQSPVGPPAAQVNNRVGGIASASSSSYRSLYSFRGVRGKNPQADLLDVNGTLYGAASEGGANGAGTVFSVTTNGSEKVLYSFAGGADGENPYAGLIDVNGTLYGTTAYGGANHYGTVFNVTTSGQEKVLHSFGSGSDGETPEAGLIDVNGTLYGTTFGGGSHGFGTVFSIATSGAEKVLYSFGGAPDAATARAGLIDVNGVLYGTTYEGGSGCGSPGCGTVFSVTIRGAEKVLYSFRGSPDGYEPLAALTNSSGALYGTTSEGGAHGDGTVFSVGMRGGEKVLYSFTGGSDGAYPVAELLGFSGMLYGTTYFGGNSGCDLGCGVIFSLTAAGKEKLLYSFAGGSDGADPEAGLIKLNGTLYGTTYQGGGYKCRRKGCGTVFAFTL